MRRPKVGQVRISEEEKKRIVELLKTTDMTMEAIGARFGGRTHLVVDLNRVHKIRVFPPPVPKKKKTTWKGSLLLKPRGNFL